MSMGYEGGDENLSPRERALMVLFFSLIALGVVFAALSVFR